MGRLWSESDGTSTHYFVWDGARLAAYSVALDGSDGTFVANTSQGVPFAYIPQLGTGPVSYLHTAHSGSALGVTDSQGNLLEAYRYRSYGDTEVLAPNATTRTASSVGNRYGFGDYIYDSATGVYFLGARAYRPSWGRFLSPDPVGSLSGSNLYVYAAAMPTTHSDPSGLSEKQNPRYPEPIASYMPQWQWDMYFRWRAAGLGPNGELPDAMTSPDMYLDPDFGLPQESSIEAMMYAQAMQPRVAPGTGAAMMDAAFEQAASRLQASDQVWGRAGRIVIEAAPQVLGGLAVGALLPIGGELLGLSEAGEGASAIVLGSGGRAAINASIAGTAEAELAWDQRERELSAVRANGGLC
ncbi:MAG: RHS repeat-associated core domain-containing protein [Candidatus Sulfotelmatobacter sp.]